MTKRELIDHCLGYADAYEDYPFDSIPSDGDCWAVIRHRQNKKSFAFIYIRGGLCINLKCEPMRADLLRDAYPAVTPAYHMNKEHWNTVKAEEIDWEMLCDMIEHSYRLTAPKPRRGKS